MTRARGKKLLETINKNNCWTPNLGSHRDRPFIPVLNATLVALGGVTVFNSLNFPLPWLLGAILPLILFSHYKHLKLAPPTSLINPARGILGIAIAAAFSPAILQSLDQYILSLLIMLPFLALIIVAGKVYYQHVVGFDKNTSVFCSLPGGLLEMTLVCEAHGADVKRVVLAHTSRVVLIIFCIPFFIQFFTDYDLSSNALLSKGASSGTFKELILLLLAATGGWRAAKKLNLSGASLVGPMLFCAPLYLFGWINSTLPAELICVAQLVLGIRIGLSMTGITLGEVSRYFKYALGLFLVLMTICLGAALLVHIITEIPLMAVLLAYIPGGQAEMNVIAVMLGLHIPYIVTHHFIRMFLLVTFAPTIKRFFDLF